jgi:hypothetical protein
MARRDGRPRSPLASAPVRVQRASQKGTEKGTGARRFSKNLILLEVLADGVSAEALLLAARPRQISPLPKAY